jgi:hypothetical protein
MVRRCYIKPELTSVYVEHEQHITTKSSQKNVNPGPKEKWTDQTFEDTIDFEWDGLTYG